MDTPDFLGDDPRLAAFSEGVDSAERLLATDPAASAVRSRSVMEQIIRWIYEVDGSLRQPPENTLAGLLHNAGFRQILRSELWRRLAGIHTLGNTAAHSAGPIPRTQAEEAIGALRELLRFAEKRYLHQEAAAPTPPAAEWREAPSTRNAAIVQARRGSPLGRVLKSTGKGAVLVLILIALFFALAHFEPTRPTVRRLWAKTRLWVPSLPENPASIIETDRGETVRCWQGPDGKKIYGNVQPADGRFKPCK